MRKNDAVQKKTEKSRRGSVEDDARKQQQINDSVFQEEMRRREIRAKIGKEKTEEREHLLSQIQALKEKGNHNKSEESRLTKEVEELNKVIQKHSNAPILIWATSPDEMTSFLNETEKEINRLFEDDNTLREKIKEKTQIQSELAKEKDTQKTKDLQKRLTEMTKEIEELVTKSMESEKRYKEKTKEVDQQVRFPFEKEMSKLNILRDARLELMDEPGEPIEVIELDKFAVISKSRLQQNLKDLKHACDVYLKKHKKFNNMNAADENVEAGTADTSSNVSDFDTSSLWVKKTPQDELLESLIRRIANKKGVSHESTSGAAGGVRKENVSGAAGGTKKNVKTENEERLKRMRELLVDGITLVLHIFDGPEKNETTYTIKLQKDQSLTGILENHINFTKWKRVTSNTDMNPRETRELEWNRQYTNIAFDMQQSEELINAWAKRISNLTYIARDTIPKEFHIFLYCETR